MSGPVPRLRRRIMMPVGVGLLVTVAVGALLVVWQSQVRTQRDTLERVDAVARVYDRLLAGEIQALSLPLEFLLRDTALIEAFQARDRGALQRLASLAFARLNQAYDITHFYLTDPNRVNFLRVHHPSRHSDRIDRITMAKADDTRRPAAGVELGPLGTLTLRVVFPWIVDGTLIGFIELGKEIDKLLPTLGAITGTKTVVVVRDAENTLSNGQGNAAGPSAVTELLGGRVVATTLTGFGPRLTRQLDALGHVAVDEVIRIRNGARTYSAATMPLLDAGQHPIGTIAVLRDISDEKRDWLLSGLLFVLAATIVGGLLWTFYFRYVGRIERWMSQAYRDKEKEAERYRQVAAEARRKGRILDQISNPVIRISLDGKVQECNASASRVLGIGNSATGDLELVSLAVDERSRRSITAALQDIRKKGQTQDVEVLFGGPAETSFDGLMTMSALYDEGGTKTGALAYVMNIARRKAAEASARRAQREAEKASKAKSEFLSRMSHELRTPLNAVMGFGQLLEMDAEEPLSANQKERVGEILRAGSHLLDLINEVLDLARIESGRVQIRLEAIDVSKVLNECEALTAPLAEQRSMNISVVSQCEQYACAHADSTRLKQVLLNLLSNAIKYGREGGNIKILCRSVDGRIRIGVKDDGPGIPAAERVRLFQPFERLNHDTHIEGTGIGLAVARRLVSAMRGNISLDSTVGEGSTFWLDLAQAATPHSGKETTDSAQPPKTELRKRVGRRSRRKILYVEDNPQNLRLVQELLRDRNDLQLIDAHTGELGLSLAQAHRPELILLDINLPGRDGYEVLSAVRDDARLRATPVVAVSANVMQSDINRAIEAGFNDYLTKPLDVARFRGVLQRYLGPTAVAEQAVVIPWPQE